MTKGSRIARSAVIALVCIVVFPAIVYAAVISGASSTATKAGVTGLNSSKSKGAKGVFGYASARSGVTYGVYGKTSSVAGYGVYSAGTLGVVAGKSLACAGCVTPGDLSAAAKAVGRTVVAQNTSFALAAIPSGVCTNPVGPPSVDPASAAVTIVAPATGFVVVDANLGLAMAHTNGQTDNVALSIDDTVGSCAAPEPTKAEAAIPAEYPTIATKTPQFVHMTATFVVAAGSHTYYLGALNNNSSDEVDWDCTNMIAMFIPS